MEDELPKMIPTGYKVKIPSALSYCCSAKMLSLAWEDVPQFDNFDLLFLCDVPRELHENSGTRFILSLDYSRMRPTQSPRFWAERKDGQWMWNVRVGVCRREHAHQIREWLSSTGLQQARLWLAQEDRLNSTRPWTAFYDEEAHTFSVTKDRNGR